MIFYTYQLLSIVHIALYIWDFKWTTNQTRNVREINIKLRANTNVVVKSVHTLWALKDLLFAQLPFVTHKSSQLKEEKWLWINNSAHNEGRKTEKRTHKSEQHSNEMNKPIAWWKYVILLVMRSHQKKRKLRQVTAEGGQLKHYFMLVRRVAKNHSGTQSAKQRRRMKKKTALNLIWLQVARDKIRATHDASMNLWWFVMSSFSIRMRRRDHLSFQLESFSFGSFIALCIFFAPPPPFPPLLWLNTEQTFHSYAIIILAGAK